jgi:hypothetical protein
MNPTGVGLKTTTPDRINSETGVPATPAVFQSVFITVDGLPEYFIF